MKKLIKIDFDNTTRERKTEDSYSELYSHDKNNGSFEFEILNDTLTTEQVIALFKFTESNKIWKTTGTVEGNKVKVTFDTSLITQNETVICYLYFDEEQRTSDTFRFKFKVKVSEIDKMSRYEVKERFINNTVIVDRLDVVTKTELQEALKNVGGIATEGLLTEVKAEELFVKKTDAVDNTNFELVKNRILALELKTDKDTVYDDSEVKGRISVLEAREDNNTIYDDTNVRERLTALESKPNIDVNNLVTKDELASKNYLTEHQDTSNFALKSEIPQPYNDSPLNERVKALESKAIEGGGYDDSDLRNRVVALESKEDKDTKYDDTDLKNRVTNLENKPPLDTSEFVTNQSLESKGYIKDVSNLVTKDELENKHYLTEHQNISHLVTKDELETKGYLTQHQSLEEYAKKSELYNDTEVKQRLTALENRPTTGGGLSTEDVATYTNNIIYVPNGNIVYDKNLKKLYIPKCNVKVGKTNYWCEAQEVTINGSAGFIVFNKSQKRIVGGDVNSTNDVLLGYYDNNIGNYYLNTFSKALKKKKIACLGDSITEGVNANGWQWHRYIDKYFKENGIETTIVNLGVGGTSVCTSSYVTSSLQPFVNRLNTIPTDTDVIVIFGGTNDWGNNATLGTISDSGSSSFYGAYKYMLEWLAVNRPNTKVITITPLKRYFRGGGSVWHNAQTTPNNKGQLLQDYVRAVKEVSEMYAIPCVDLHNESGLNPVLEIVRTKYMADGLHPTAEGNKKMYPIILDKLKPLVKYD